MGRWVLCIKDSWQLACICWLSLRSLIWYQVMPYLPKDTDSKGWDGCLAIIFNNALWGNVLICSWIHSIYYLPCGLCWLSYLAALNCMRFCRKIEDKYIKLTFVSIKKMNIIDTSFRAKVRHRSSSPHTHSSHTRSSSSSIFTKKHTNIHIRIHILPLKLFFFFLYCSCSTKALFHTSRVVILPLHVLHLLYYR